MILEGIYF